MAGEFGVASGFFVDQDKIVTNIHVAAYPGIIFARSLDEKKIWTVEGITAFDAKNDLVILKVAENGVPFPLADSDTVKTGDTVMTAGYPDGKYRITKGTIYGVRGSDKWIQMRIALSGGNSGGPVQNSKGEVIGIVSGVETPYSYAIPSNALSTLLTHSGPIEPLTQWRKRKPIRAYVYSVQGQIKYNINRYDEAIADLDKAIELNPKKADAYYNRGLSKFRLGDLESEKGNTEEARRLYEAGIEDSTQAIKLIPEDVFAYHNRAGGKFRFAQSETDSAKAQQYYQDAINDWTQVIKLNSELVDPYSNRAAAKINIGESKTDQGDISAAQELYVSAIQDYTQAIQLTPGYSDPYINRGYAQFRLGKTKVDQGDIAGAEALYMTAIRDCTQAIQLNPENAAAYGNRGVARAALGDIEGTIEDFDAAIRLNPKYAEYFYERGLAKEALGQKEAAKADFKNAKELDPEVGK
jgi:tetratricopeptide (TPR) repeat protein